ncbi:MAG: diacylglycerol kinase family lipid kinase [Acidobacteriota bacterium]|nr:MAG: diacylglycerol kinase family lipid kinase [Acidobacteriota bacterium]
MPTDALILCNPAAGRGRLQDLPLTRIRGRLREGGIRTELLIPQSRDSEELVGRLQEKELLIVCGGDGTIHKVLPAVASTRIPLAILPAGTANVLAKELRIPSNVDGAIDVILQRNRRTVHLGKANGQLFHLMAGVGADGFIISQVGASLKRMLGILAFWITGLTRFWSYPLSPFEITLDGTTQRATFAVISNSKFYGRHLSLAPSASVFEPKLDLCLFKADKHLRFLRYLIGVMLGGHLEYPDVSYSKVSRLEIKGSSTIPVQLDGELAGYLPRKFEVAEESINAYVG